MVSVLGAQFKYGTSRPVVVPSIPDLPQAVGCDHCSERAAKLHYARRALQLAAAERDAAAKALASERLANEEAAAESASELLRVSELLAAHQSQSHTNVARQAAGRRATESAMEARAVQSGVGARILRGELASAEAQTAHLTARAVAGESRAARLEARLVQSEAELAVLRSRVAQHEQTIPKLRLALLRLGASAAETARAGRESHERIAARDAHSSSEEQSRAVAQAEADAMRVRAVAAEAALQQATTRLAAVEARASAAESGIAVAVQRGCRKANGMRVEAEARLTELSDSFKLQEVKVQTASAELERVRLELAAWEGALKKAEARRVAEADEASRKLRDALAVAEQARQAAAQAASGLDPAVTRKSAIRQLLGSIRVAVLAPCVKLVVDGEETLRAGSPSQLDFGAIRAVIEQKVLAHWTRVVELPSDVSEDVGGEDTEAATDMFPELEVTMGHVTREVSERLVNMIKAA